jgi:hypothetical protein
MYGPQIANPQIICGRSVDLKKNVLLVIASVTLYNPTETVTNGNDVSVTLC